ncbi:MAG: NAD(P)-dependent oxidoreductase [Bacillota bacterium]
MKVHTHNNKQKEYFNQHLPASITVCEDPEEADVLIRGRLGKEEVHDKLKAVIIPFTGHNGIDIDALKERDVALFNTQAHAHFVSEKALMLTLALLGNLTHYHNNLKAGDWSGRNLPSRVRWVSLWNKHVGIYGYGTIGRTLKTLLDPFNVTVHVIDRGKDYPGVEVEKDLYHLTTNTDITVIAAPLTASTENAFTGMILDQLKDKYLINVGRGKIIDEKALYDRLESGVIKGFASDVWFQYPKENESLAPSKYPIHTLENVVLSPHTGGFTTEAEGLMLEALVEKLKKIETDDFSDALDLERLS